MSEMANWLRDEKLREKTLRSCAQEHMRYKNKRCGGVIICGHRFRGESDFLRTLLLTFLCRTGYVQSLGRIQDLVRGGSDKRPQTLSYCYCHLTSPFSTRKIMLKYFCFTLGHPNHPLICPGIQHKIESETSAVAMVRLRMFWHLEATESCGC